MVCSRLTNALHGIVGNSHAAWNGIPLVSLQHYLHTLIISFLESLIILVVRQNYDRSDTQLTIGESFVDI